DVSGSGRIRRPHADGDRPAPRTVQGRLEVLQLLRAQDLPHLLQQFCARLVHQLADVLLVCLDGCHGLVLLLAREFQIVNDPLDAGRTKNTRTRTDKNIRTRTDKTRNSRTRTFDTETKSAAGTEPARSGRQLLDLVLVEGAILVRVASGDQVVHPFGQLVLGDLAVLVLVERQDALNDVIHTDTSRWNEPRRRPWLPVGGLRHSRSHEDERRHQGGRQPPFDASHACTPLPSKGTRYWKGFENFGSLRNFGSVSVFRKATRAAFSESVKFSRRMRGSRLGCGLTSLL